MIGDVAPPQRSRALWWVALAFTVIAIVILVMGALAICAVEFRWRGFWTGCGQPFATVLAEMAALAAGALAFYNGERQRAFEADQWHAEQRRAIASDLRGRFAVAQAQLSDAKAESRRVGARRRRART